ncbi:winged helix-turn-helix domain-containing protein [Streptomyces sp. NBC_01795]|uniref:BTAD domain-containing putative transcriptional regulator n=1 Tax=Streptomyces sp. NBC_01795 TaxID=2975943 RepID=UPI002DD99910|nr:BTAD domain-containing putative transcriptional regulator [Streptomyces sp. NBC_01795]WSA95544.1 winged helix-turn-helix domain-containing protein [Streptomyces sp. NBC_01795]
MRFGVLGPLEVWRADGDAAAARTAAEVAAPEEPDAVPGPGQMWVPGPGPAWVPVSVPEVKVRTLLARLLVAEGRVVPDDALVDALWGERLPADPANSLQTKVSQLRRALERTRGEARTLVVRRASGYLLRVAPDAVDTGRFRELARRARAAGEPGLRAELFGRALELWRGEAFADFAAEAFARGAAARLEEERLAALEEWAHARLALGEHTQLAGELAALVARYPLRERLRGAWILALYRAGRQSEALAAYEEIRTLLADELGVDPGPELAALHLSVLKQAPALDAVVPAARPLTNLPEPPDELVGREREAAAVAELLGDGRLVTLTGPGGVGKTRLALAVARRAAGLDDAGGGAREGARRGGFADGVWLVELAAYDSRVAEAVLGALGVRDETGSPPEERLAQVLRERHTLLVLDNCERVVGEVAALVAGLLRTAPGLRLLVTSQEPLALPGEAVLPVGPLHERDALRLFAARATAAGGGGLAHLAGPYSVSDPYYPAHAGDTGDTGDPGVPGAPGGVGAPEGPGGVGAPGGLWDSDGSDKDRVAEAALAVCRRLDGLPLALELAATRVRALGVAELAARLDDRFRILGGARRGIPARQRTLRAALDWSWELLDGAERTVLRRLAVHADGCTLASAEAVCADGADTGADEGGVGADGGGVGEGEVLDVLARLVDRSLVVPVETAYGRRYRLLESVGAYARERLAAAGEEERVRERQLRHFTVFAERAAAGLRGAGQRRCLGTLDAEAANLRAALETASAAGAKEQALRLVTALTWYWFLRGRTSEARCSLRGALALPAAGKGPGSDPGTGPGPGTGSEGLRATARALCTGIEFLTGVLEGSGSSDAVREALAGPFADEGARAEALLFLAVSAWCAGDLPLSEELTALVLADPPGPWGEGVALGMRARQALLRGDLATAGREGRRCQERFRSLGDRWGELQALESLSSLAEIEGDYARARGLIQEGLRAAEELQLWPEVTEWLTGLGRMEMLAGEHARAAELHERARTLAVRQGHTTGQVHAEIGLGLTARRAGDLDTAEPYLLRMLEWHRRADFDPGTALLLAELGFVAELRGDGRRALALHTEGLEVARRVGDPRGIALALEGLAAAHSALGALQEAARLLAEADGARRSVGAPLPAAERADVARVLARLPPGLARARTSVPVSDG